MDNSDMLNEETVMRISRGLVEPKWLLNERLRAFHIFKKLLSTKSGSVDSPDYSSAISSDAPVKKQKSSGKFEGVHADSLYDMLEGERGSIAQNMFKSRMGNPIREIDEAFVGAFFTECNFFGTECEDAEAEEKGDGALGTRTEFSADISSNGGISINFFIVSSGTELNCNINNNSNFSINEFYIFDEADVLFSSKIDGGNAGGASCGINLFAVNKDASATVHSLVQSSSRLRTEVMLFGEGSEATVRDSFALGSGIGVESGTVRSSGTVHISSSVAHLASNTDSSITMLGALDGNARASVRGKISIPKNIKSATSFLEERVLLLSDGASAEAIPILEIESDDVDVGHSASISDIPESQRFYARSRGLDDEGIKRMVFEGIGESY